MYINKTRSNKIVNNVSVEYTNEDGQQDIIVISLAALLKLQDTTGKFIINAEDL